MRRQPGHAYRFRQARVQVQSMNGIVKEHENLPRDFFLA